MHRACVNRGLSALTLGFSPPTAAPGGLLVEIGDVLNCDQTAPITIVTKTVVPAGCPAVNVPNRTVTLGLGDDPLIRGFAAPACAGTYIETMRLRQGATTLTTASASYQVT